MTYADQMGVIGADADTKIAAITTVPITTHHDAAVAVGHQADVDLAAAKPPIPPAPKMLVGSSPGAWNLVSTLVSTVHLAPVNIIRCFNPQDAADVPPGFAVAYSNDGGHNRGADLDGLTVGSAAYTTWMKELHIAFGRDDAPGIVLADHEFDIHGNDYAKTAREYTGLNLLLKTFNVGRKYPVQTAVVTTGMVYDTNAYEQLATIPCKIIGCDNYARKHWDTMAGFGKRIGRPYGVFENGIKAGTPAASGYSDQAIADAMNADFQQALALGFLTFCYWPNGNQSLVGKPISISALTKICAAHR